uniref:Interleukin-1 beta n=1 Tax=Cyprinus carpio TaxID=7962 RepID=A0A8C2BIV4_CYPCA
MACHEYVHQLDLSEAFETDSAIYSDSADSDELDCPDPQSMSCQCDMHDIKLELSSHPHSMRQVVNIIIAVERLKHIKNMSSGKFCDEELLGFILENVIEERLVKPLNETPIYNKTSLTLQCTICDKYKKTMVQSNKLSDEPLHLKLLHLNYVNIRVECNTKGSTACVPGNFQQQPLPCLYPEASGSVNTIKAGDPNDSLLFFRKETGTRYNTFESVKYPGWFISTAFDDWEKVEMNQMPTTRTTNFTLEDQKRI